MMCSEATPTLSKKGVKSQVWHAKPRTDDDQDSGSSAAPINMVFIMPKEFMAPRDEDYQPELEEAMAQLNLEQLPATFEKPEDEKKATSQSIVFERIH